MLHPTTPPRGLTVLMVAATLLTPALGACGSPTSATGTTSTAQNPTQSFPYSGRRLAVKSDHSTVDVRTGGAGTVTVARAATTVGKTPADPAWTLQGDTLDLGTVCDDGYVGLCEITYTLTVPKGVQVDVQE